MCSPSEREASSFCVQKVMFPNFGDQGQELLFRKILAQQAARHQDERWGESMLVAFLEERGQNQELDTLRLPEPPVGSDMTDRQWTAFRKQKLVGRMLSLINVRS